MFVYGYLMVGVDVGELVSFKPVKYKGCFNRRGRNEKKLALKYLVAHGYPRESITFITDKKKDVVLVKEIECTISK